MSATSRGTKIAGFVHPDLYQLLAYATAANLPGGLLVYAAGEDEPATFRVAHAGTELHVAALRLSGEPKDVLRQMDDVALLVRRLRQSSGAARPSLVGSPGVTA